MSHISLPSSSSLDSDQIHFLLSHVQTQAKSLSSFLEPMLEFVPEKRATAEQMLQHPWLKGEKVPEKSTDVADAGRRAEPDQPNYPPPPPLRDSTRYERREDRDVRGDEARRDAGSWQDQGEGDRYQSKRYRTRSRSADGGSRRRSPGRREREEAGASRNVERRMEVDEDRRRDGRARGGDASGGESGGLKKKGRFSRSPGGDGSSWARGDRGGYYRR